MTTSPATSANLLDSLSFLRAGFWIRFLAALIDLALVMIPFCIFVSLLAAAMGISNPFFSNRAGRPLNETLAHYGPAFLGTCTAFFALEGLFYFAVSESSSWHATLGKRLLGLYVGDASGHPLDFWRAALRFCAGRLLVHVPVAGGYYFLLDCLCVGLLPGRRALHDRLSGCEVLREGSSSTHSAESSKRTPARTRGSRQWQDSHACTTTFLHPIFPGAYTGRDSRTSSAPRL